MGRRWWGCKGILARDLAPDKVDASQTFNAGPAETQALLSGAIGSLMAGELIVQIALRPSLGQSLNNASEQNQYAGMMAAMVVILAVGLLMDALVFGRLEGTVLRRRGLAASASEAGDRRDRWAAYWRS